MMTCKHGFIGACADCDGCGQQPEVDIDLSPADCEEPGLCPYCDRMMSIREREDQGCCNDCGDGMVRA
jgi:hypothetical protein